jgi:hypothetical protein
MAGRGWSQAPTAPTADPPPAPTAAADATSAPAAASPSRAAYPSDPATVPTESADYRAQRLRVWNSPAMVEARNYIRQYSLRSVQFGPRQAQQYLSRLEQLSPSEQTAWLQRFQARRAQLARAAAVARLARQQGVSQALDRIEQTRQAYTNINQGQTGAAEDVRTRVRNQQEVASVAVAGKQIARDATLDRILAQNFNPFDPTLDPAAGSFARRAAGAAVTLPGDLVDVSGNNIVGTDADIAAATPEGAAGYAGGEAPGAGGGLSGGAGAATGGDGAGGGDGP